MHGNIWGSHHSTATTLELHAVRQAAQSMRLASTLPRARNASNKIPMNGREPQQNPPKAQQMLIASTKHTRPIYIAILSMEPVYQALRWPAAKHLLGCPTLNP